MSRMKLAATIAATAVVTAALTAAALAQVQSHVNHCVSGSTAIGFHIRCELVTPDAAEAKAWERRMVKTALGG